MNALDRLNMRKVTRYDNLVVTHGENILVVDNGCDQSIISINSFIVNIFTGVLFNVGGSLGSMKSTNLEIVNDAFTVAILDNDTPVLLKFYQALLDLNPNQEESLLQPHQARANGVIIDDCASCYMVQMGTLVARALLSAEITFLSTLMGGSAISEFVNRMLKN